MKRNWFVGIDISKKTLDVAIYNKVRKDRLCHFIVDNNKKGFEQLLKFLKKEGLILSQTFICLEYCGVYGLDLGLYLEGKINFCFVSPLHIKKSLGLIRGKNDKLDSIKIARFCYLYRDELESSSMPSSTLIKLRMLMSERNRVVKSCKAEKQVLKEFSSKLDESSIARMNSRINMLKSDIKAIEQEALLLIETEKEINQSYKLLVSVTGIGMVNAIMMILCSNNFNGITNARSFACYCGVAPFEYSSGSSVRGKTKVSKLANKEMKAFITNAARSAVVHDLELRLYYKRKREEGKSHGTVMNAVKFKIITRAYAVINRKTPFVNIRKAA